MGYNRPSSNLAKVRFDFHNLHTEVCQGESGVDRDKLVQVGLEGSLSYESDPSDNM